MQRCFLRSIFVVRCSTHRPRAETRRVDDDINFLSAFDLIELGDRMSALGSGLPMHVLEAVARNVFPQFLKLASASDLPLRVNAEGAAIQEERGKTIPLAE